MKNLLIFLSYFLPILLFLIILFYVIIKDKKWKKKLLISIFSILAIYILMCGFCYYALFFTHDKPIKFNAELWKSKPNERWLMKDDLRENKLLEGKDTNYLKLILGPPDTKLDSFAKWNYHLGEGGSIGFLFHELIIEINDGEIVKVDFTTWH